MQTIPVQTPTASYDVLLGTGLISSLRSELEKVFGGGPRRYFVVTSPDIWTLWGDTLQAGFAGRSTPEVLFVPSGEEHKRLPTVERLAEELARAGADRGSVLIAFGGGVIGDVTGFLAAIYMRGIAYVQVPTTLLAQVDSSVGGKSGVNLEVGKNLVGAFHHPRLVLTDTTLLRTLPYRELRAGLQESLKAGLIRNTGLFDFMEGHSKEILEQDPTALTCVVAESIRVKAEVVGADEHEGGLRMILNFGHTAGHALEAVTGYSGVLHGEAVGWGMLVALSISQARGLITSKEAERARAAVETYGVPNLSPGLLPETLLQVMSGDKKNVSGVRRYVLLRGIGQAYVATDVTDSELLTAMGSALSRERP